MLAILIWLICCREIGGKTSQNVANYIAPLAKGYLEICEVQKPEARNLTEFYGLRDFYRFVDCNFCSYKM